MCLSETDETLCFLQLGMEQGNRSAGREAQLSPRQVQVLEFVRPYIEKHGYSEEVVRRAIDLAWDEEVD